MPSAENRRKDAAEHRERVFAQIYQATGGSSEFRSRPEEIFLYGATFLHNLITRSTRDTSRNTFWGNLAKKVEKFVPKSVVRSNILTGEATEQTTSRESLYDTDIFSGFAQDGGNPADPHIHIVEFADMVAKTAKRILAYELHGDQLDALNDGPKGEVEIATRDMPDSRILVVTNRMQNIIFRTLQLPKDEMIVIREYERKDQYGFIHPIIEFVPFLLSHTAGWGQQLGEGIVLQIDTMRKIPSEFASQEDFLKRHEEFHAKQTILVSEKALQREGYIPGKKKLTGLQLTDFYEGVDLKNDSWQGQ